MTKQVQVKKLVRPDWNSFWFLQALMYSTRGTCDRLRTACIIVKNKRLVGAGYNGSPHGLPHCDEVGHLIIDGHCERTLHGEENAIVNTEPANLKGSTAYIIGTPCIRCAKMLINSGVTEVNYLGEYANSRGKDNIDEMAQLSGVNFVQHTIRPKKLINQAIRRLSGPGGALQKK